MSLFPSRGEKTLPLLCAHLRGKQDTNRIELYPVWRTTGRTHFPIEGILLVSDCEFSPVKNVTFMVRAARRYRGNPLKVKMKHLPSSSRSVSMVNYM